MSNYLKKSLFTFLILAVPFMNSTLKAMDDGDYDGSSSRVHKVSFMTEDQKDVSSSVKNSTSSQVESLEESQTSWSSYFLSPAKYVVQSAYDVMNFATKSPRHALFVGTFMTLQTLVAAQDCCVATCWYALGENCPDCTTNLKTCGASTPICAKEPGCYRDKFTLRVQPCDGMQNNPGRDSSVWIYSGACIPNGSNLTMPH